MELSSSAIHRPPQTHLIIRSLLCRTHTDDCRRGLCGDIFSPSCATLRNYCVYYHALVMMSGRGGVSKGKVMGLERKQRRRRSNWLTMFFLCLTQVHTLCEGMLIIFSV